MKILLFGGTTEGRILATKLLDAGHEVHICVATEYGAMLLPKTERAIIHAKRMDVDEMVCFMQEEGFDACLDVTHPYAKEVSENIASACKTSNLQVYRVLREESVSDLNDVDQKKQASDMVMVDSVKEAVAYLKHTTGNIFVTTGSKELQEYTAIPDFSSRVFARVLSTANVLTACEEMGFLAKNVYAMQGPFSLDMNEAMLQQVNASFMVTKASGDLGGFMEKCEAAKRANATLVVVGRPKEPYEKTYSMKEMDDIFSLSGKVEKKIAYIVGIGPGHPDLLTVQAVNAVKNSACVMGVKRCLESVHKVVNLSTKKTLATYQLDEMMGYLAEHNPQSVAFLYTGDIGFYSGAIKLREALDENLYQVVLVPGISSVHYLCDKVGVPWQDMIYGSMHGRVFDLSMLQTKQKLALILGKSTDVDHITSELCKLGRENDSIFIGENLSYENEKITSGKAQDFLGVENDPLAVLLIVPRE